MNKKKVVVIGCGLIGHIYVKILKKLKCKIIAIVDYDKKRIDKVIKICDSKTLTFSTYNDLFKNIPQNNYDTVAIAVPASNQLEIIKKFAMIKKNILCEKPFTLNYQEAKEAIKYCKKYEIKLAIGFKMRYEKIFIKLKKIIEKKIIGNLRAISISYFQKIPNQSWAINNGIHKEMFVHPLDLIMWLIQDNIKLQYVDKKINSKFEQTIYTKLKSKNIDCFIHNGWLSKYANINGKSDFVLNAIGSKGHLVLIRPDFLKVYLSNKEINFNFSKFDYDEPFLNEWKDFIYFTNTNKPGQLVVNKECLNFHQIVNQVAFYE